MNLIVDESCGYTENTWTYGMVSSWTPTISWLSYLFSTWAKHVRTKKSKFCRCVHCFGFFAFIKAVYKSTGILVALLCKKNTRSPRWNSPKSDYKWRIMDLGEAKGSRWPSFEQVTPVLKKKSALTSHCHPSGDRLLGPEQTPSANSLPRVCKKHCSSASRTAPGTLGA